LTNQLVIVSKSIWLQHLFFCVASGA